jgi:hypothetical protein
MGAYQFDRLMTQPGDSKPSRYPPRPERLLEIIRSLADETKHVILSDHARERMAERDIDDIDVMRVLRRGRIRGEIEPGRSNGEWKVKVVDKIKGAREAGVVTLVVREKTLFIKTVEWEDLR